jgi:hypothetical protein
MISDKLLRVNRIGGMIAMAIPGSTTASEEKHPARKPADNYCDRVSLPFLKIINDNSIKIKGFTFFYLSFIISNIMITRYLYSY